MGGGAERGRGTTDVFATSTGTEGFETRDQDRVNAFRFDPASDSGGWHDSSEYPVGVDNPLNGHMYKPLYFDLGRAIHGANSVPTAPASKGCARLRVQDQITLLEWLGLDEATSSIWRASDIQVTVNVQGEYISRLYSDFRVGCSDRARRDLVCASADGREAMATAGRRGWFASGGTVHRGIDLEGDAT